MDSFMAYGRASLLRPVEAARAWAGTPPPLLVRVLDGPQEGCEAVLSDGLVVMGGGLEDDVTLLDASLGDGAVTLAVAASPLGPLVSLRGVRGAPPLAGLPPVGAPFRLPREIALGDVRLRLSSARATEGRTLRAGGPGTLAALGLGLALVALVLPLGAPSAHRFAPARDGGVDAAAGRPDDVGVMTGLLREGGLDPFLDAAENGTDLVVVEGTLPEDRLPDWRRVHNAYDSAAHERTLLTRIEIAPAEPTLPAIAAVRLTDPPALVLSGGGELRSGEVVADDWTIGAITPEGVALERGTERLVVEF